MRSEAQREASRRHAAKRREEYRSLGWAGRHSYREGRRYAKRPPPPDPRG